MDGRTDRRHAIWANAVCGLLHQEVVDQYTKLMGFPPEPSEGIESYIPEQHAESILGLVNYPSYQHWKLDEAAGVMIETSRSD